ncbi:MAG: Ldh family oxidoreductase [Candidatus Latescibacterota bacterium]|nr:Ldh family oxidoreductase [Candidatus Latescibacterota bacterium]
MPLFPVDQIRDFGRQLFCVCGAPEDEAAVVADHLVEASLMGIDSHGVIRYIMYAQECVNGNIRPGAKIELDWRSESLLLADCNHNFGQVGAYRLVDELVRRAGEQGIAFGVTHHCHHVGRLGAYPQAAAQAGLFGFAVANSDKSGHFVVPHGGREARLATNPLAWAAPTATDPILLDMSTSMTPEGKIRTALHANSELAPGRILDAEGRPTTDPKNFYGPPRGSILPFGGDLAYRGYGLSLLVEILGSTIAGVPVSDDVEYMNGFGLIAIDPGPLTQGRFAELCSQLAAHVTSSAPAPSHSEVMLPGEREFRTLRQRQVNGIPLAEESCRQLESVAAEVGLNISF